MREGGDGLAASLVDTSHPEDNRLTGGFVHRELVGQDSSDLTECRHLNAVLVQFAPHVADLFLWKKTRSNQRIHGCVTCCVERTSILIYIYIQ